MHFKFSLFPHLLNSSWFIQAQSKNKSENVSPDFYKNVKYRISLPQHGTTAKLQWYFREQKDCSEYTNDQAYCDTLKKMKENSYNYLELIWDKANTRFNVGEGVKE